MKLNNHLISLLRNFRNCIFVTLFFIGCATVAEKNLISEQFDENYEDFYKCYLKERKSHYRKELKGNIIFDFTIDRVGKVVQSKIQNSYWMSDKFKKCLLNELDSIVFTPSESGRDVNIIHAIKFNEKNN